MKTRMIALGSLALLMGTGVLINAQTPAPSRMRHEKHPELMRALKSLQRTKADLQKADRDFGGHRTKAVELTQQAIDEIHAAIEFDKN